MTPPQTKSPSILVFGYRHLVFHAKSPPFFRSIAVNPICAVPQQAQQSIESYERTIVCNNSFCHVLKKKHCLHVRKADIASTCKKLPHLDAHSVSSTTVTCDLDASRVKPIPTRLLLPCFITSLASVTPHFPALRLLSSSTDNITKVKSHYSSRWPQSPPETSHPLPSMAHYHSPSP
jgi:hypothetical protein